MMVASRRLTQEGGEFIICVGVRPVLFLPVTHRYLKGLE